MSLESLTPDLAHNLNLENPYVGMRPFSEIDQDKFHGRSKLTEEIMSRLEKTPLTTVYGHSGVGKSSIICAGVIPAFRKKFSNARIIQFRPDQNPFFSLSHALLNAGLSYEIAAMASDTSSHKFREVHAAAGNPAEPWLIFIDQFEEIFTRPAKEDAPIIAQFIQSLIDASRAPISSLRIILALRDDFMGRLNDFKSFAETIDKSFIWIKFPDREELCQIVENPAAAHGVRYEPNLVGQIINQAEATAPEGLPLLQYTLERLWDSEKADATGGLHDRTITLASYNRIGGVKGALMGRLAEVYKKRNAREMRQIQNILLTMVEVTNTDLGPTTISLPATLDHLRQVGGVGSTALIQQMLKERILTKSEDGKIVEFAHDSLLWAWDDLSRWIRELQPEIREVTELEKETKETFPVASEKSHQPKPIKKRVALIMVICVTLFALFTPPSVIGLKGPGNSGTAITFLQKIFAKKESGPTHAP